jgi:transposase
MGHTDMRRGMQSLAAMVQQHFLKDPFAGDLWVFRGRSGSLVKIIWHDGLGMSLYAKRLEKGKFVWPSAKDGVVSLTSSQLACLLDGIDWRNLICGLQPTLTFCIAAALFLVRCVTSVTLPRR